MAIYTSQSGAKYDIGTVTHTFPDTSGHNHQLGSQTRYSPKNSKIEMADTNPLKPMERDPFAFSTISYPSDMADFAQNGHYILFYINVQNVTKYPYTGTKGERVGGKTMRKTLVSDQEDKDVKYEEIFFDNKDAKEASYAKGLTAKGLATSFDSDGVDLYKNPRLPSSGFATHLNANKMKQTTRVSDSIALYLPPNIEDSYTATYNAHQTGMLGFLASAGLKGMKAWKDQNMRALAEIGTDAGLGFIDYATKKAMLGAAEFIANAEGGEEMFNKAFARADNPYMEVLFDKINMREFTYNFTFVPKNEKEQMDVKRIIQMFRFHMAPELRSDHNRFITLPSEFDIHYMYQAKDGKATENDFYNKIATCVLQDCKVNYTPDGVRSHADGSPVHITMALTFKETEMITKEKIDQGY